MLDAEFARLSCWRTSNKLRQPVGSQPVLRRLPPTASCQRETSSNPICGADRAANSGPANLCAAAGRPAFRFDPHGIRSSKLSPNMLSELTKCCISVKGMPVVGVDGIEVTTLYAINADVGDENDLGLAGLPGDAKVTGSHHH